MAFVRLTASAWLFAVLAVASTVSAASLAACGYDDQSYDGVGFACDLSHACPAGRVCVSGRCVIEGTGDPPPPAQLGVDCGGVSCQGNTICCNDFTIPALACLPSGSCTFGAGREPVTCDGPEDCGTGACCTEGFGGSVCLATGCEADDRICHSNADCPPAEPFCCPSNAPTRPFKVCDSQC